MSNQISYSEFERKMREFSSLETMTQSDVVVMELVSIVLAGLCDIAVSYCNTFARMIIMSKTQEGRDRYRIIEKFGEIGSYRAMATRLHSLCDKHSKNLDSIANKLGSYDKVSILVKNLDYVEDTFECIIKAYGRFIYQKVTKKTLSTPLDPGLFSDIILCIVYISIVQEVYDNIAYNYPAFKGIEDHRFLRMNQINEQVRKMLNAFPYHDTKGNPLTYNINGLINCKEAKEMADDILKITYSVELLGDISYNNTEGRVNVFKDYDPKSIIDKYSPTTLDILEYSEKYNNKYKN